MRFRLFFECRQKALATKQHPGFYRPDPVLRLLCRWRFHSHIPVVYLHRFTCIPGYTVLYQSYHLIRTEPVHTCPILLATDSWFAGEMALQANLFWHLYKRFLLKILKSKVCHWSDTECHLIFYLSSPKSFNFHVKVSKGQRQAPPVDQVLQCHPCPPVTGPGFTSSGVGVLMLKVCGFL